MEETTGGNWRKHAEGWRHYPGDEQKGKKDPERGRNSSGSAWAEFGRDKVKEYAIINEQNVNSAQYTYNVRRSSRGNLHENEGRLPGLSPSPLRSDDSQGSGLDHVRCGQKQLKGDLSGSRPPRSERWFSWWLFREAGPREHGQKTLKFKRNLKGDYQSCAT